MKSIRLNKSIRSDIANNIREAYVTENPAPVVEDLRDVNLKEIIWQQYLKDIKPIQDIVDANPQLTTHLRHRSYFYAEIKGMSVLQIKSHTEDTPRFLELNPSSNYYYSWDDDNMPVEVRAAIDTNKAQAKVIRKAKEALSSWKNELSRYMQDVIQTLDGVNTSGQLLDVWPEVEKFLPKGTVDPSAIQLPAVNTVALNRKLGL
jgi:hypothetical protein